MNILIAAIFLVFAIIVSGLLGAWMNRAAIKRLKNERDNLDIRFEQKRIKQLNKRIDELNGIKSK